MKFDTVDKGLCGLIFLLLLIIFCYSGDWRVFLAPLIFALPFIIIGIVGFIALGLGTFIEKIEKIFKKEKKNEY